MVVPFIITLSTVSVVSVPRLVMFVCAAPVTVAAVPDTLPVTSPVKLPVTLPVKVPTTKLAAAYPVAPVLTVAAGSVCVSQNNLKVLSVDAS